ncbi:hypothetical protein LX97_03271 [Nonlabens dokdonensis]|jgi:hypothetical protein|uniref:Uncharacterized protein n=2 Tax=Nonlabens dokdonensis TaxID=328515 RepID=L7W5H4_NONDD|nr:hypothetical protein DDD_1773 [Nonlabens dokdonensis DSW-6]PZX36808.1 hypothetical protein LX97_03271 [Nonlabens dokdonensis]
MILDHYLILAIVTKHAKNNTFLIGSYDIQKVVLKIIGKTFDEVSF